MIRHAYDKPGPYHVGAAHLVAQGPDGIVLPTEVWYPTATTEGDGYCYLPGIRGLALEGCLPMAGPRPVIVFSHGHTGIRFQSITLAEHLASHGFVVAAPDHVGNTFVDTVVEQLGFVALRRPLDMAAVFDAVCADPRLAGCVDPAAGYAAMGHSFGGWTAVLAAGAHVDRHHLARTSDGRHFLHALLEMGEERFLARPDPRVWAAVAMAPTGYPTLGPDGLGRVEVPVLVLGGSEDEITPWHVHQRPMFEALRGPMRCAAQLHGASHYTFCDAGKLVPMDPYTRGSLPLDVAHPLIGALSLAFLEHVLGVDEGRAAGWMPPDDPRIEWLAA